MLVIGLGGTGSRVLNIIKSSWYQRTQDVIEKGEQRHYPEDWLETLRRKANQNPFECTLQEFRRRWASLATFGQRLLHANRLDQGDSLLDPVLSGRKPSAFEKRFPSGPFLYFDIALFSNAYLKSWAYSALRGSNLYIGSGRSNYSSSLAGIARILDPRRSSKGQLREFTKEIVRYASKKGYRGHCKLNDPNISEPALAQKQAHYELQQSILGKAAAKVAARQRSRREPKQVNWALTRTAGKQTHKTYFKISPHRSIYGPEVCDITSIFARNSAASETQVSNYKEILRWLRTISRRWASISLLKNGLAQTNYI
jgi:hypothetical protein